MHKITQSRDEHQRMHQTNKNKTNRDIKKWGMLKKIIFKNLTRKSKCIKSPNLDMNSKEKTNLDIKQIRIIKILPHFINKSRKKLISTRVCNE